MTSLVKSNKSTFDLLLIVFFHLRLRRKIQIGLVFILMLISGVTEVLSLGAVLPFLAVISDPNNISNQELFYILNL